MGFKRLLQDIQARRRLDDDRKQQHARRITNALETCINSIREVVANDALPVVVHDFNSPVGQPLARPEYVITAQPGTQSITFTVDHTKGSRQGDFKTASVEYREGKFAVVTDLDPDDAVYFEPVVIEENDLDRLVSSVHTALATIMVSMQPHSHEF